MSGYDPERHGPKRIVGPGFHGQVRDMVRTVPPGAVTTYGDVAAALGLRRAARQVGYALAALGREHDDVPWHRVVNAQGEISPRANDGPDIQVELLRREGVEVDDHRRIVAFRERRHVFP